jgi:hypothetical protein
MNRLLPSCKITGAILIGLVLLTFGLANAPRAEATPGVSAPDRVMRPCLSDEGESSFPCVWYAPGMGNHEGHSFRIYRDGRVKQISDRRAFNLLGGCGWRGWMVCVGGEPVLS